jgi:hypothetical protein
MNPRHKGSRKGYQPFDPSPKDIQRACRDIQSSWSPRERQKRAGRVPDAHWMPPCIHLAALAEAADECDSSSFPYDVSPASDRE